MGFIRMVNLFELLGVFVRRKSLDVRMVYDQYSWSLPFWWRKLEKVLVFSRRLERDGNLYVNWEWLAQKFEKMKP